MLPLIGLFLIQCKFYSWNCQQVCLIILVSYSFLQSTLFCWQDSTLLRIQLQFTIKWSHHPNTAEIRYSKVPCSYCFFPLIASRLPREAGGTKTSRTNEISILFRKRSNFVYFCKTNCLFFMSSLPWSKNRINLIYYTYIFCFTWNQLFYFLYFILLSVLSRIFISASFRF